MINPTPNRNTRLLLALATFTALGSSFKPMRLCSVLHLIDRGISFLNLKQNMPEPDSVYCTVLLFLDFIKGLVMI
ncbi:hypothetical protein F5B21DRAFT_472320 [Xylaria acuta]|nr:hypothetical protein F5B21DRAFT_472320 [Xylaria acuta]